MGSKPGSPIFRSLGKLLRWEDVREDCGDSEFLQFAGSSQKMLKRAEEDFSFCCKVLAEKREGVFVITAD